MVLMNKRVNENFRSWLKKLAADWDLPIEQIAYRVGDEEITNRVENYPKVSATLNASPFDIRQYRMLHSGNKTLTIEELKTLLQN